MNIFNITVKVKEALLSDNVLKEKLNSQVLALEGKEYTNLPFVTVTRMTATDVVTKDMIVGNEAEIAIAVFSKSYQEACELSERIYDAIHNYFAEARSCPILEGCAEDFDADTGVYYQVLEFSFRL